MATMTLGVKAYADTFGLGESTVRKYIKNGKIDAFQILQFPCYEGDHRRTKPEKLWRRGPLCLNDFNRLKLHENIQKHSGALSVVLMDA